MIRMVLIRRIGRSCGSVMYQSCFSAVAPSTAAAS